MMIQFVYHISRVICAELFGTWQQAKESVKW